jgi:hypothetical protein
MERGGGDAGLCSRCLDRPTPTWELNVAFRRFGTVLLAGALVTGLTACGDDDDETETGGG